MPYRLVQQNPRPARTQHHFHLAGRRRHGAQLQNRASRRLARQGLRALRPLELFQPGPASASSRAFGRHRALFRDHKHIQPAKRLRVAGKCPVRRSNQNPPQLLAITRAHLHDARIKRPRRAVGAKNQFQPRRQVKVVAAQRNRVQIRTARFREPLHRLLCRTRRNQRRSPRRMQQPLRAQVVGIGVTRSLAAQHPNAAPRARSLAGRLHNLLVHAQRGSRNRLKIKVRIVAAGAQRLAQAALQQPLREAEFLKKVSPMAGCRQVQGKRRFHNQF